MLIRLYDLLINLVTSGYLVKNVVIWNWKTCCKKLERKITNKVVFRTYKNCISAFWISFFPTYFPTRAIAEFFRPLPKMTNVEMLNIMTVYAA